MGVLDGLEQWWNGLDSAVAASHHMRPDDKWNWQKATAGMNGDALWGQVKPYVDAYTGVSDYQAQVQTLEWQKRMQQQAWEREDTAVQRRAADLAAAGLNPVLAAGSAASSSSPIQLQTPRWGGNNPIEKGGALVSAGLSSLNSAAQYARTQADTRLVNAQADKAESEAEILGATKQSTIDVAVYTASSKIAQASNEAERSMWETELAAAEAKMKNYLAGLPTMSFDVSDQQRPVDGNSIFARAEAAKANAVAAGVDYTSAQAASLAYQVVAARLDADAIGKLGLSPKLADMILRLFESMASIVSKVGG